MHCSTPHENAVMTTSPCMEAADIFRTMPPCVVAADATQTVTTTRGDCQQEDNPRPPGYDPKAPEGLMQVFIGLSLVSRNRSALARYTKNRFKTYDNSVGSAATRFERTNIQNIIADIKRRDNVLGVLKIDNLIIFAHGRSRFLETWCNKALLLKNETLGIDGCGCVVDDGRSSDWLLW